MSEYQYYEFRTVDRSLTAQEIAELRKLSSRAEITATSFTNTYSYGNFRGNPDRMMEQYFDAFVYVTNWGTRHFMVRLPVRGVDPPAVEAYAGGGLSFWIKGEFVILSFEYAGEGDGEWQVGEEWMPGLILLRDELLNGDLCALYLGWLSGVYDDVEDAEPEPPVPAGMRTLTAAQDELVEADNAIRPSSQRTDRSARSRDAGWAHRTVPGPFSGSRPPARAEIRLCQTSAESRFDDLTGPCDERLGHVEFRVVVVTDRSPDRLEAQVCPTT